MPSPPPDGAEDLARLDAALLDLRRFAEAPPARLGLVVTDGEERVELSTVLVVNAVARSGPGDCDIQCVATGLRVAHSTASRLVERAVRAGMVDRERSTADPRRTSLSLTPEGRRLDRQAVRFRTRRLRQVLTGWSADEIDQLTTLLERFAESAHAPHQERP